MSSNVPHILEENSHASRMIAMWWTRSKEQENQIEALIWDVNSLLKENEDKSLVIAKQKAELERLRASVKEPIATIDASKRVGASGDLEDTDMEVNVAVLDHVVEDVTYGVLEPLNTPIG
jgi:predicted lipoprotein